MRAFLLSLLTLFLALPAASSSAQVPPLKEILEDRTLGKADAPVTIIEYASLTCSHCAHFETDILPLLEKQAIETGKARLIYRDFALDGTALKAAAIARCLPKEQYIPFVKLLFARQGTWAMAADPIAAMIPLASLAGLDPETAKACAADTKILDTLTQRQLDATAKYKVAATPTFVFDEGAEKIEGAAEIGKFMEIVDRRAAAATAAAAKKTK